MVAGQRKKTKRKPVGKPVKTEPKIRIPKGCFAPDAVPKKWRDLLKLIPKYDCFLQSRGCFFDPESAVDVISFFENVLTHAEGKDKAKQPFILERWQKSILSNLFGWKRYDSKGRIVRRYRTMFLYVPRKNGKTPFAAGICLYMLLCDNEPGAQISSAASCEKQAELLYRHACGMVRNSKALDKRCRIYKGRGSLAIHLKGDPNSSYVVLTSSKKGKHGGNPHLILVDELHEIEDAEMIDAFETSFISDNRSQSMMIYITTADYDRVSICNDKYKKACRVRDNDGDEMKPGYDPSFLPVVYETPKNADWKDPKVWMAANPNWGVSVSADKFKIRVREVIENPVEIPEFLRVNLNMITQTSKFWLNVDHWDAGAGLLDLSTVSGKTCFTGLDLSSVSDLTAFVTLFPLGDSFGVLPKFWIPEGSIKTRSDRDGVPYDAWVRQGWMLTTPGDVTDYDKVREDICDHSTEYAVKTISIDASFQGQECSQRLMAEGFDVAAHGQGFWSMAAPTQRFEQLLISKRFIHDGNPVMRWMITNAMYEQDNAGRRRPSKRKSSEKIDGVASLIMAIGAYMETLSQKESVYEKRGLITIGGD